MAGIYLNLLILGHIRQKYSIWPEENSSCRSMVPFLLQTKNELDVYVGIYPLELFREPYSLIKRTHLFLSTHHDSLLEQGTQKSAPFLSATIFVNMVISPHLAHASEHARGAYGGIKNSISFVEKTS